MLTLPSCCKRQVGKNSYHDKIDILKNKWKDKELKTLVHNDPISNKFKLTWSLSNKKNLIIKYPIHYRLTSF